MGWESGGPGAKTMTTHSEPPSSTLEWHPNAFGDESPRMHLPVLAAWRRYGCWYYRVVELRNFDQGIGKTGNPQWFVIGGGPLPCSRNPEYWAHLPIEGKSE